MTNFKEVPVKILAVGDSGVGKSLLTSILTDKNGRKNECKWTIGANTEIMIHSYKAGTLEEALYCCEIWDISGNQAHRNSRNVFYRDYHALIFVHDLTNRKSLMNIMQWSEEVLG
jgi:Rab-like protein 3